MQACSLPEKGISSLLASRRSTLSERDHCASQTVHAKLVVCRLYSND